MLTLEKHDSLQARAVIVVGRESVGKSQLISTLTGRHAGEMNFRGSTVTVQRYRGSGIEFIDTPGILRKSDTETTRMAIESLEEQETVILVVQATNLDDDLVEMLPLVYGKRGIVVATSWDRVDSGGEAAEAIRRLEADAGVSFFTVDARNLDLSAKQGILKTLDSPKEFSKAHLTVRAGWRIVPKPGWLEHRFFGPILSVVLLLTPALATILIANRFADWLHPLVDSWVSPAIDFTNLNAPGWVRMILTAEHGDFGYGLLNMGPFLLVWALPTVVLFSLILGVYKSSGLIERINGAIHPFARPFGLSGRDVIRVMMGFGCNVPAVISTRSCSACSRGPAISAIAFGSACSYQLPATFAVLGAAATTHGRSPVLLASLFVIWLLTTTLLYLRMTATPLSRSPLNVLMTPGRPFMQWPSPGTLWREARGTIQQFLVQALPVFAVICIVAALLSQFGVLAAMSNLLGPIMRLFDLPMDAALPVVLASIRKDGIFLFASDDGLAIPMSTTQTLTAVYLSGVLLPCLVTALTIAKETNWEDTARLLLRQAGFAILFSAILAWGGKWLLG
jgi:small GTP-binding protein